MIDNDHAKVDTRFYVSHDSITEKLMKVISEEKPWLLGELDEGWEWIAFTFNCQEQISLSKNEIQEMIESSQDVVQDEHNEKANVDATYKPRSILHY